ncbi:MAG: serine/threonine-protein kinase [Hyalangium sp.]|uniref:serine/threonine-protein kinase n=1 Tax=Hyalangium sp. TaxID=2028555 RepID=UPI00389A9BBE
MMNPALRDPDGPEYGELLGPWRVVGRSGYGTYGSVYRVVLADRPEAGEYALKLARYADDARFEREAELLSRIHHPHVPRYHGKGSWRGAQGQSYPYVVMQLVEGVPLYDWARHRSLTQRQVFQLLAQVARALEATHEHGVHRDVKGDNVLVDRQGRAMLVDFGLGFYSGARPMTDTVIPPGTEPYRSPQLLRFRYHYRRDTAAHYAYRPEDDVYAFGVMAYRLVTGTYPPPGTDPECADDPERPLPARLPPPSELASVGPELEVLILRMLSEKPGARGTAGELAQAMEQAARSAGRAANTPIRSSPSAIPTEEATHPGRPRRWAIPGWVPWAGVVMVGVVLVAGVAKLPHGVGTTSETFPDREEQVRKPPPMEAPDGGVGDVALTEATDVPRGGVPSYAIGVRMPKTPFPGQRKPPCERGERAINDGCWALLGDEEAPCSPKHVEYEGRCYMPAYDMARQPTSEPP